MKKALYVLLGVVLFSGCSISYIEDLDNDAKRFAQEYSNIEVDDNNPMIYKTDKEIIEILKSGTGVIYFGFPECPWCQSALPVLMDAAKDMNTDEIYYFNPKEIRGNNTETYKEIVQLLGDNLAVDENGNRRLYVPDVYFVADGKIIGHHFKTVDSQTDPVNEALTEEEKSELKTIYKDLITKTYDVDCDC